MNPHKTIATWLWKIPVCGAALALGEMFGGAIATALGLEMPRAPSETDVSAQLLLLFAGGMVLAAGLAAMALGLTGRWWERWAVLGSFLYVVWGVGNALETSIFTTLGGDLAVAVIHLPAAVLGALAVTLLFPYRPEESLRKSVAAFFPRWKPGALATRLVAGLAAFPFFYFLFGMMVVPIVEPHYARLDFLVIPPVPTILKVLFLRSALFLLVSLPLIIGWRRSRGSLTLALGLGHFVAVGLAGLIQASFLPAILRWTHGVEILADSMCYAWVLAWLFFPRHERLAQDSKPALRERAA